MGIHHGLNRGQAYTLYLNHALSTWNARSYEFAAVLFTASAFPEGLRAASLVGISNSLAAILFASAIGRWIDRGTSRLKTLLTTISVNRLAILVACLLWFIIVGDQPQGPTKDGDLAEVTQEQGEGWVMVRMIAFTILLVLGIVEGLSRKANVISIERDWVPVIAPVWTPTDYTLTHVNAMMSRIDIICKLSAPIAVSGFLSVLSTRVGVFAVLIMNALSFIAELRTARNLWDQCPQLAEPKMNPDIDEPHTLSSRTIFNFNTRSVHSFMVNYLEAIYVFFDSDIWMPALAMCVTHASILSVTGITIVFFLDSGYSLRLVTGAEALSTVFEFGSTLLYPFAVQRLVQASSPTPRFAAVPQDDEDDDIQLAKTGSNIQEAEAQGLDLAISRVGLSGSIGMASVLLPTVPILLYLTHTIPYPLTRSSDSPTFALHPLSTLILFFCLASSRLGRGLFSLSTQQLAQSRLPADQRSSFAGTESTFMSIFGLAHNLGTAIWSQPRSFGWLAMASWIMVFSASALYLVWWSKGNKVHGRTESWRLGAYSSVDVND